MRKLRSNKIKLISLLLVITFLVLGVGCSSETTIISTVTTTVTETTTPTQTTPTLVITPIPIETLINQQKSLTTPETEENKIITLILESFSKYPGYAVIQPITFFDDSITKRKDYYLSEFKDEGYNFTDLLEQLIEKNQYSYLLTVKSSLTHKYYIDYRGVFAAFSNIDPAILGSEKRYEFYPDVKGTYWISIPTYDTTTGYVMVNVNIEEGILTSVNKLVVYQYKDGEMIEITSRVISFS